MVSGPSGSRGTRRTRSSAFARALPSCAAEKGISPTARRSSAVSDSSGSNPRAAAISCGPSIAPPRAARASSRLTTGIVSSGLDLGDRTDLVGSAKHRGAFYPKIEWCCQRGTRCRGPDRGSGPASSATNLEHLPLFREAAEGEAVADGLVGDGLEQDLRDRLEIAAVAQRGADVHLVVVQ